MTLLRIAPDLGTSRVLIHARFSVPADMPDTFVRDRIYPEARQRWLNAMQFQGYELHGGKVFLHDGRFAHIEASDSGEPEIHHYDHGMTGAKVDRIMTAWFLKKDTAIERLDDGEKAAIRDAVLKTLGR